MVVLMGIIYGVESKYALNYWIVTDVVFQALSFAGIADSTLSNQECFVQYGGD